MIERGHFLSVNVPMFSFSITINLEKKQRHKIVSFKFLFHNLTWESNWVLPNLPKAANTTESKLIFDWTKVFIHIEKG